LGRVSRVQLGGAQPVCAPTKKGPPDGDTDREDEREQVSQLGGQPNFNPGTLAKRSHTEYVTVDEADLTRMLQENLVAERIVITSYQEIIRWIGDADPTTRRLMEKILEQEEEHADDLNDLLGN
jgi:bacterioferritin